VNEYLGFNVQQHGNTPINFIVFVAKAKEVVHWAHADNIKLDRGNVQRALIEARWRQIKKFFTTSPNNVIPTSVTIAFEEALPLLESRQAVKDGQLGYHIETLKAGLVRICFPDAVVDSSFIIDGQHRLRGMSELDFDVYVPVCLFPSLSKLERAFQFVTINNKSHKVPTDNLKALIANFEQIQSDLRTRLTQASITTPKFATVIDVLNEDTDSPFYKMIDWVNNRFVDANPTIQPTALENSLKAIVRAFPETKEDESDALLVLSAIWRAIFTANGVTSLNAKEFPNLILKATIQTISEMIVEKLKSDYDPAFTNAPITASNGAAAAQTAQNLVTGIPVGFWQDPWLLKSLDTSAGRELIQADIRALKKAINDAKDTAINWKAFCQLYRAPSDDE
jgi:DGQHR domain-containing protein